jgi:RNA polymerase sigma-70 factor (ECF subfamily)
MSEWKDDEALAAVVARGEGSGENAALEALFRRHVDGTYGFARRFLPTREDAEEAVSETWLRAGRGLRAGQFRGEARFRTWLFGIARRVCLERLRQPRLPTLSLTGLPETARGDWVLFAPIPDQASALDAALEDLAEDHRLVLTLCDLQGLSDAEVAPILGRSLSAVKSLRARARRALRDLLVQSEEEL